MTEKAYFQNQVKKNRQVINEGPQLIMYEYDRSWMTPNTVIVIKENQF